MEGAEEGLVERGFGEGILILELRREIDTVVLTDVANSLRWQLLGLGRDAHGIEDVTTGSEITPEGSG